MKAEIIAVGTELLLGQVVNTNATFLSEELAGLGFEIYYQTVVGDNPERLVETLALAETRSQLIVLCGGLGPTDDDLTRDVVADHVGEQLVMDEASLAKILKYVSKIGHPMTENNKRQALSISGGQVIENPTGLAIGTLYQAETVNYLLLPGPPRELYPMFHQKAKPLLAKLLPQDYHLTSRVLRFYGIGESRLVTELAELIASQSNPTIAPYAKPNEVTLRLTAKTKELSEAETLLDQMETEIMASVGEYFYGYGEENSLVQETVKLLIAEEQTVTCAESLTAGMLQSALGSVPGVSAVFPGGYITYSDEGKASLLGVPGEVLTTHGAVSEACAIAMAEGARQKMGTDFGLSLTGVAGPTEVEGQKVGTVWIGIASKNQPTIAKEYFYQRDRETIRQSSVMAALGLLRQEILAQKA